MSNPRALFPLATAAVPLAVAAPAIAVGAVIGLALVWLFTADEKPATPTPAELDEAPRRERLRANEAELANARR